MATIYETLLNARYDLCDGKLPEHIESAKKQLEKVVALLRKGYSLEDEVNSLLEKYGDVENVPEKEGIL